MPQKQKGERYITLESPFLYVFIIIKLVKPPKIKRKFKNSTIIYVKGVLIIHPKLVAPTNYEN